jgi:DNA modification methylase
MAPEDRKSSKAKDIDGLKTKDLVGIPWLLAFALRADGWYLRSDIIWSKPNPMPESVTDRPTKAHEYVFLLAKSARYYYDAEAVSEECGPFRTAGANNGIDRPKTPDPRKKQDALGKQTYTGFNDRYRENPCDARNRRTVWTIATQPYPEAHFATYPEALVEPCIKAGCPEGGTVLDPFLGSGTTLAVAAKLGRSGIGIELNPAYVALAEKRIGLAKNPHTWRDTSRADAASLFHQEPA